MAVRSFIGAAVKAMEFVVQQAAELDPQLTRSRRQIPSETEARLLILTVESNAAVLSVATRVRQPHGIDRQLGGIKDDLPQRLMNSHSDSLFAGKSPVCQVRRQFDRIALGADGVRQPV